ncbi:AAA family ATPase [Streptomyces sp. 2RAF24]|uniref:AAA family ATPase n=1 Tax=Streptomyces sp. 2RAF24 TaxID=3232997 RepID=UPI003F96DC9F
MSVHDLTKTPRDASDHDGPDPRRETARDRRVPLFVEELTGTLSVHAQYVLHGNVDDLHLVRPRGTDSHHGLVTVLWNSLRAQGYRALVRYDQIDGFRVAGPRSGPGLDMVRHLLAESGPTALPRIGRSARTSPLLEVVPQFQELVRGWAQRRAAGTATQEAGPLRVALLVDHAGRLPTDPGRLSEAERDFFLACLKLAGSAEPLAPDPAATLAMPEHPTPPALFNPVIWLTPGERDLPSWFVSGSNRIRRIAVPEPDADERRRMARLLEREHAAESGRPRRADVRGAESGAGVGTGMGTGVGTGAGAGGGAGIGIGNGSAEGSVLADDFARAAQGMNLRAMRESVTLAVARGMPFAAMPDAVRVYRLGVEKNPWRREEIRQRIKEGEERIPARVLGQDAAVGMTLAILKRAALGLSGAQASTPGHRPRGTLFFAGPTGTGKTELAKAVASVLFDSDQAYLRFDMSEFSAPHSADRLVGAPPGYVGFEAGGELTTAVRANPFRVILFDEIDKADKGVLDKFLQVLEDGRLTDGQGVTTYFSECVLIFTSNLGVQRTDPVTEEREWIVEPGTPYRELAHQVKRNVKHHFEAVVGRPELMNRIGGNVVVFGFITEETAARILDLQIGNIRRQLAAEHQLRLELSRGARAQLATYCTRDLWNGGRGIGMVLETHLLNPLAGALFDRPGTGPGETVLVRGVHETEDGHVEIDVEIDGETDVETLPGER